MLLLARCSWSVNSIYSDQRPTILADERKSTRERTLRGRICECTVCHFFTSDYFASLTFFLRLLPCGSSEFVLVAVHAFRYGKLCLVAIGVWLFFVGVWPRSAVTSPLFARRNANLICGSSWVVWFSDLFPVLIV